MRAKHVSVTPCLAQEESSPRPDAKDLVERSSTATLLDISLSNGRLNRDECVIAARLQPPAWTAAHLEEEVTAPPPPISAQPLICVHH